MFGQTVLLHVLVQHAIPFQTSLSKQKQQIDTPMEQKVISGMMGVQEQLLSAPLSSQLETVASAQIAVQRKQLGCCLRAFASVQVRQGMFHFCLRSRHFFA